MAKQDMDVRQRDPRPHWAYWNNRTPRTEAKREERYQSYLESSTPYFAKVEANGDKPWFSSEDERRELWFRRYRQPQPPAGLNAPTSTQRNAA